MYNYNNYSNFSDLINEYCCPLSNFKIFSAIKTLIAEYVPDLEALNLDNNRIHSLECLKDLGDTLKNLKILHIANNKVNCQN